MAKELIVIRHGETDWNAQGRLQGVLDIELNSKGLAQAERAADKLKDAGVEVIYSSTLSRARKTAEIIAQTLGVPLVFRDALREKHFGAVQGMCVHEIQDKYGHMLQGLRGCLDMAPPEGESNQDLICRLTPVVHELNHHEKQRILVVTHGAVARVLFKMLSKPTDQEFFEFQMDNCQMIHFTPERNGLYSCRNHDQTSSELYSE